MFNSKLIKVVSLTFIFKLMALGILLIPWAASASNRNNLSVQHDAECMVCLNSAREINSAEHRLTRCCKQFICKKDADTLASRARENLRRNNNGERHARCPYCRQPLAVITPAPQRNAMPRQAARPSHNNQHAAPRIPASAPRSQINQRAPRNERNDNADQQFQQWLATQENLRRCPTPGCSYAFINESSAHTFICPQCNCDYCSDCLIAHDSALSCATAMQQLIELIDLQLNYQAPAARQAAVARHEIPAARAQSPHAAFAAQAYAMLINLPERVHHFNAAFNTILNRVSDYLNRP